MSLSYTQEYRIKTWLHYHQCMEIGRSTTGSGVMFINGTIYPFSVGTITIIPPNCLHDSSIIMSSAQETPSNWEYIFVDLQAFGLLPLQNGAFVTDNSQVSRLFRCLFNCCQKQPRDWQKEAKLLLQAFMMEAGRLEPEQIENIRSPYADEILFARHQIALGYANDLSVELLSQQCGLSVSSFRRHFTAVVGESPQQYLIRVRLSVAENLLEQTDDRIIDIAEQVGFHSLSSFNRLFSKYRGYSPRTVRRRCRQSR